MTRRLCAALTLCGLLALATSASAECAWVLWNRIQMGPMSPTEKWSEWTSGSGAYQTYSKCWAKIHAYTRIPEEGSMADWLDWMRGAGRYDAEMRTKDLFHLKENEVYINATEFGALALTGRNGTEWRCLPETMDPRGPTAR